MEHMDRATDLAPAEKPRGDLQGLRRWSLATRDAHGLYEQFGFRRPANPDRLMEIVDPDVYLKGKAGG